MTERDNSNTSIQLLARFSYCFGIGVIGLTFVDPELFNLGITICIFSLHAMAVCPNEAFYTFMSDPKRWSEYKPLLFLSVSSALMWTSSALYHNWGSEVSNGLAWATTSFTISWYLLFFYNTK
jgi:hypothetical protein